MTLSVYIFLSGRYLLPDCTGCAPRGCSRRAVLGDVSPFRLLPHLATVSCSPAQRNRPLASTKSAAKSMTLPTANWMAAAESTRAVLSIPRLSLSMRAQQTLRCLVTCYLCDWSEPECAARSRTLPACGESASCPLPLQAGRSGRRGCAPRSSATWSRPRVTRTSTPWDGSRTGSTTSTRAACGRSSSLGPRASEWSTSSRSTSRRPPEPARSSPSGAPSLWRPPLTRPCVTRGLRCARRAPRDRCQ